MKHNALEMTLLLDYYGELLTEKQRTCFDLYYNQDLSLGEIGQILGISRQGVHDNLSRAESLLRNMEEKTGCVKRDMACRKAVRTILDAARKMQDYDDKLVSTLAAEIVAAAQGIEE
jgi:predicted DNA-binding protein YlxM (UPF0122 family)